MTTAQLPHAPVRTFIYGSCVSRDTFEYLDDDFTLAGYVARQSLISAGSALPDLQKRLSPIASPFQQRMVDGDLTGDVYRIIEARADELDMLVVDLVDERGGVMDFGGDRFATRLAEFWSAGGREASSGRGHLQLGSDEHFERWKVGARRLLGLLLDTELFDRTVVIRTPWAHLTDEDVEFEIPGWMTPPRTANRLYTRYFDYLVDAGLTIIELPEHLARTSEDHQWGMSPFHYTSGAYEHLAAGLREFALAGRAPRTYNGLPRRRTAQWGSFSHLSTAESFREVEEATGFFTLTHAGLPVDLRIEDNHADTTVVTFSAAVGTAPLDPPIFSGDSVTARIDVNRVFISDPGLLTSPTLGLAWHLGTSGVDLTDLLAQVIAAVQSRLGAQHLVLHGIGGAGFAALNLGQRCAGALVVPVNAHTRILGCAPAHWEAMARACFGARSSTGAREILESHRRSDMGRVYADGFECSVIHIQSTADSSITTHLLPWFDAITWQGEASILFSDLESGAQESLHSMLRRLFAEVPGVDGDWRQLAGIWNAQTAPTRAWVKESTGR